MYLYKRNENWKTRGFANKDEILINLNRQGGLPPGAGTSPCLQTCANCIYIFVLILIGTALALSFFFPPENSISNISWVVIVLLIFSFLIILFNTFNRIIVNKKSNKRIKKLQEGEIIKAQVVNLKKCNINYEISVKINNENYTYVIISKENLSNIQYVYVLFVNDKLYAIL